MFKQFTAPRAVAHCSDKSDKTMSRCRNENAEDGVTQAVALQRPLLSVVIPTRNRGAFLEKCLESLVKSAHAVAADKLEVVCVDNFSVDQTRDVVEAYTKKYGFIRYEKHQFPCPTAEESLFNGLKFARGEYVWSLGDDDLVVADALASLLPVIESGLFDFILLNCGLKSKSERIYKYLRCADFGISYGRGIDLFRDFGVVTATTTMSCLCFRKSSLGTSYWKALQDISGIYSHSISMLAAFHDKPAAFIEKELVIYSVNSAEEQWKRFDDMTQTRGLQKYFPLTIGLIDLLAEVSSRNSIPLGDIVLFEEFPASESGNRTKSTLLGTFIIRFLIIQLRHYLDRLRQMGAAPHSYDLDRDAFSSGELERIGKFFERAKVAAFVESWNAIQGLFQNPEGSPATAYSVVSAVEMGLKDFEKSHFMARAEPSSSNGATFFLLDSRMPWKFARGKAMNRQGKPVSHSLRSLFWQPIWFLAGVAPVRRLARLLVRVTNQ